MKISFLTHRKMRKALDQVQLPLMTILKESSHRSNTGAAMVNVLTRPSVFRCSLKIERDEPDAARLYIDFTKTGFRPYDIAVTAALLIAKRHLRDELLIHSNGGDRQWADGRRICQSVLGY